MIVRFLGLFMALAALSFPALAQTQPGEPCPAAGLTRDSAGPEQTPALRLICDGTAWRVINESAADGRSLFQVGNDAGACAAEKTGRLRYVSANDTWEYCSGSAWRPFEHIAANGCSGPADCVEVGNVCADGTKFAGCNPRTGVQMFTTFCDLGRTWNGSACSGTRAAHPYNDGSTYFTNAQATAENDFDGKAVTPYLVSLDANSNAPGVQPHSAALACDSLQANGYGNTNPANGTVYDDWYLPAIAEAHVLYANRSLIGDLTSYYVTTTAKRPAGITNVFSAMEMTTANPGTVYIYANKNAEGSVRCLRNR